MSYIASSNEPMCLTFSLLSSSHLIGKVGSKRTHKADDKVLRVISTTPLPIAYEKDT